MIVAIRSTPTRNRRHTERAVRPSGNHGSGASSGAADAAKSSLSAPSANKEAKRMRSIQFVAGLFVFGLASIVIAGIDLYHAWEFRAEGKPALMELVDRQKPVQESSGVPSYEFANVRYKFAGAVATSAHD